MASMHVALLRGINLGGKNKLPMPDLARIFADEGCSDVRTYIQSGNVVFDADQVLADSIQARVSARVAERFGLTVPVILRTAGQMEEVVRNNPFLAAGASEDTLHVLFLDSVPESSRIDALDKERSRPDQFSVRGREVYLWLPNGVARTKLTNEYFDSRLTTTSTGRNWRTVRKLFEMTRR